MAAIRPPPMVRSATAAAPPVAEFTWKQRLTPKYFLLLIRDNPVANLLLISAIIIGFFHGWLKLKFPGGITVFAYDIPLMLALAMVMMKGSPGLPLFPKSRTSSALQVVMGICIVYGLLPNDIPLLVRLASFRGWALVPLMFLLGYHLFRSRELLNFYGSLILLLSVITAIYGSRQDPEELRRMAEANATLENIMKGSFYGDEEGTKFRVFSTFVSAGAFGSTMAYSLLIGLARYSNKGHSIWSRVFLAMVLMPIAYGIFLSAARSAAIIAIIAVLLIAWYRKSLIKFALPPAVILGGLLVASNLSGSSSMSRMSAVADPSALMSRVAIVVRPAFNKLLDYPLGGGLGRSGHGLPAALGYLAGRYKWRPVDGDIGRVAVDFGIIGLVAFSAMFISGTRDSFLWMKQLRGTELDTVAVIAGAMFVTAFISFPTGSPFLAIPMGAIIWFHLGALNRLYDDHKRGLPVSVTGALPTTPVPELKPGRRPLPKAAATSSPLVPTPVVPTAPTPVVAKPKRFLYHGNGSKPGPRA
ncbi:MAG: hypothetical protein J0M24_07800 [Verrucomicrobia bacterium]|nr:hypothetical protein [Verrucomicrobiota bacterium]